MENSMEEIKMEGELSHKSKLYEELDSLQIKSMEAATDEDHDKIVTRINEIEKELGIEESLTPAA